MHLRLFFLFLSAVMDFFQHKKRKMSIYILSITLIFWKFLPKANASEKKTKKKRRWNELDTYVHTHTSKRTWLNIFLSVCVDIDNEK
jgi:hypothetical protein